MIKKILAAMLILVYFASCNSRQFDSTKWKSNSDAQYYMLRDLMESGILIGKTKLEVIELLDTVSIKKPFQIESDSWMYIIIVPQPVSATKSPVKVLDVEFKNGNVEAASIRK